MQVEALLYATYLACVAVPALAVWACSYRWKLSLRGIVGATVLGFVGIGLMAAITTALWLGAFLPPAGYALAVALLWLATQRIRGAWVRILLRAFVVALFFFPFIPHPGVEWNLPWPPAGYPVTRVLLGLKGQLLAPFDLGSILAATLILWSAGLVVYRDRHRHDKVQPDRIE